MDNFDRLLNVKCTVYKLNVPQIFVLLAAVQLTQSDYIKQFIDGIFIYFCT